MTPLLRTAESQDSTTLRPFACRLSLPQPFLVAKHPIHDHTERKVFVVAFQAGAAAIAVAVSTRQ